MLSPRHSSLESLIPKEYPFVLPHEMVTLGQGSGSFYAPSSLWGLIQAGALSKRLIELDHMSSEDLADQGESLRDFVSEVCSPRKVKATMEAFIEAQSHVIEHACKI